MPWDTVSVPFRANAKPAGSGAPLALTMKVPPRATSGGNVSLKLTVVGEPATNANTSRICQFGVAVKVAADVGAGAGPGLEAGVGAAVGVTPTGGGGASVGLAAAG